MDGAAQQAQQCEGPSDSPFTDDEVEGATGQVLQRVRSLPPVANLGDAALRHRLNEDASRAL
eukprot:3386816-Pyramimonas_sp.AAC.1